LYWRARAGRSAAARHSRGVGSRLDPRARALGGRPRPPRPHRPGLRATRSGARLRHPPAVQRRVSPQLHAESSRDLRSFGAPEPRLRPATGAV